MIHRELKEEEALMGNGDDDTIALQSITLLQERFRQLQRTKERREERNLLRVFAAQPHPELLQNRNPELRPPSPLQLDRGIMQQLQECETSLSIGYNNMYSTPKEMEVDTSLHL